MKILNLTKWLLLISGIIVIVLGISLMFLHLESIVGLAIFIALAMLLSGVSEILSFFFAGKLYRSGWVLVSGIVSILFGGWMLFGRGLPAVTIMLPFVFAGWVIAGGVTRAIGAFALKAEKIRRWGWLFASGVLNVLMGALLMYSPWLSVLAISYLISFAFISHGINNLISFFALSKVEKFMERMM